MIKAGDLRLGNRVHSPTHNLLYCTVCGILPDSSIVLLREVSTYDHFDNIEPVPISPSLLKRCGFGFTVSESTSYFTPVGEKLRIEFDQELICGLALETWDRRIPIPILTEVKYLHQLQNFYYSHTGNELEIKL